MKYIFYIILTLVLFSCGSRKVAIQEIKKDSLKEIETKIVTEEIKKIDSEKETNINTFVYSDEIILTPIDSSKEIIVDGKTYKNVVLSIKKTKSNILYNNKEKVSENALKHVKIDIKDKTLVKENIKVKNIDRKQNYWNYLWLLLIPVVYYLYRKYKSYFLI
jgi:hypothetical protein